MNSLLQSILDSPEDDEPRLVLADALMERGDPRGDFIRVQCALGRTLHGARGRAWSRPTGLEQELRKELEKRERIALRKHQKAWIEPFRAPLRTWSWRRGFVEEAVCDAGKYLAGADLVFAHTPLQTVKLTATTGSHLKAVVEHRTTPRLRSLNLFQQKIGVEGATSSPRARAGRRSASWCCTATTWTIPQRRGRSPGAASPRSVRSTWARLASPTTA